MKRDEDYIRELLFELEASDKLYAHTFVTSGSGPEDWKRRQHFLLLADAGLLDAEGDETYRMTNAGHDFLDSIRNEGIWAETKALAAKEGGSFTLRMLQQIATALLKKKLKDQTGLEL